MRKLVNAGRPLVAVAVTIGSWSSRHRIIASLIVFAFLAAGVVGGTWNVMARQDPMPTGGTSAPGSHEFWDSSAPEANFCNACHNVIRTELEATAAKEKHQGENCLFCHSPGGTQHAADTAMCVDCHSSQAGELSADPHESFYTTVGEQETTASWACKACHTKVEVDLQVTENPALPLQLGPTYSPPTPTP